MELGTFVSEDVSLQSLGTSLDCRYNPIYGSLGLRLDNQETFSHHCSCSSDSDERILLTLFVWGKEHLSEANPTYWHIVLRETHEPSGLVRRRAYSAYAVLGRT